jgi:hypothetical protein
MAPVIVEKPKTIKIAFPTKGQYLTKGSIAVPNGNGSYEYEEVQIPIKLSRFINCLENYSGATYFSIEGPSDYSVVFENFKALPDQLSAPILFFGFIAAVVAPFGSAVIVAPWPDYARAEIKINIYDKDEKWLETIEVDGKFWYCNWGPLLLTKFGRKKAWRLYYALSDRLAVKTIEAIQNDIKLKKGSVDGDDL